MRPSSVTASTARQNTAPLTAFRRYTCASGRAMSVEKSKVKIPFEACQGLTVQDVQVHKCEGMSGCKEAAFKRNAAKLENERCVAPKV